MNNSQHPNMRNLDIIVEIQRILLAHIDDLSAWIIGYESLVLEVLFVGEGEARFAIKTFPTLELCASCIYSERRFSLFSGNDCWPAGIFDDENKPEDLLKVIKENFDQTTDRFVLFSQAIKTGD